MNCWQSNPDGAGIMYPSQERNILVIEKGLMTLDAAKAAFAKVPEGVPVTMHFRIATHGSRGPDMTHPFFIHADEVGMAHNGVLPIPVPLNSIESDTALFARKIAASLPKKWFKMDAMQHLIEEYMGRSNKMVVMDKSGSYKILNEAAGTWDQGVWFSNQSFRRTVSYSYGAGWRYDDYDDWENTSPYGTRSRHGVGDAGAGGGRTGSQPQGSAEGTQAVGAAAGVVVPRAGGTHKTDAAQDAPTEVIIPGSLDDDPFVQALKDGKITDSDLDLFNKSIGSMTDAEWERYQVLMGV